MDWAALATQIPIVVVFVWFTLEVQKRNTSAAEKRDAQFLSSLKEQADQWRSFFSALSTGNTADIDAMRATADHLIKTLDQLLSLYSQHDSRAQNIQAAIEVIRADMAKLAKAAPRKGTQQL
jgi:hypothetical protein